MNGAVKRLTRMLALALFAVLVWVVLRDPLGSPRRLPVIVLGLCVPVIFVAAESRALQLLSVALFAGSMLFLRDVFGVDTLVAMKLIGLFIGMLFVANFVLYVLILPLVVGAECPGCGGKEFARIAVESFGPRYYRCQECGLRCKRSWLGHWQEVKATTEDTHYLPKRPKISLELDPWEEQDVSVGAKAIDSLVRSQRRRHGGD
ncbi:MAG TPA: hypothetical protein VGZ22_21325 [Isosphaeraceae bacterium]|jgi:hypothetical protein|nr:hypothetical protein [Isosphaeraceae bacterium]